MLMLFFTFPLEKLFFLWVVLWLFLENTKARASWKDLAFSEFEFEFVLALPAHGDIPMIMPYYRMLVANCSLAPFPLKRSHVNRGDPTLGVTIQFCISVAIFYRTKGYTAGLFGI